MTENAPAFGVPPSLRALLSGTALYGGSVYRDLYCSLGYTWPDLIVDEAVCVQQVPVDRDDLLIAALPNGYFSADWDIFQNHALIRHLQERYDYRLFGLGASWLGFQRDSAPSPAEANALVADLQRVYAAGTHDIWSQLAATLATRTTLLLGYTEDFSEQLP